MTKSPPVADADPAALQRTIVEILDAAQIMSLATIRPDGWPQVTHVNFLRDGHALYFLVSRDSQKLGNIQRDSRVSIAIADIRSGGETVRGLSMSARVSEIIQPHRITQINTLIHQRPAERRFTPHPSGFSVAVLEARPELVSVIDYTKPPGRRHLVRIVEDWRVETIDPAQRLAPPAEDWRQT